MKSTDNTIQGKYFQEASILLAHEGFDTHAGDGELLQVSFHGNPLCEITKNGGTRYRHEDVSTDVMSDALEKATSVAATAAEYMCSIRIFVVIFLCVFSNTYKQAHNVTLTKFICWKYKIVICSITQITFIPEIFGTNNMVLFHWYHLQF